MSPLQLRLKPKELQRIRYLLGKLVDGTISRETMRVILKEHDRKP